MGIASRMDHFHSSRAADVIPYPHTLKLADRAFSSILSRASCRSYFRPIFSAGTSRRRVRMMQARINLRPLTRQWEEWREVSSKY